MHTYYTVCRGPNIRPPVPKCHFKVKKNKRIQHSCVCLWNETVNTLQTRVFTKSTGVFDAVLRRKAERSCESNRWSVCSLCGRTGYHLHTRSSVCHSWHLSEADSEKSDAAVNSINKTSGVSAPLPHWFTGAANHNLRLPCRSCLHRRVSSWIRPSVKHSPLMGAS